MILPPNTHQTLLPFPSVFSFLLNFLFTYFQFPLQSQPQISTKELHRTITIPQGYSEGLHIVTSLSISKCFPEAFLKFKIKNVSGT